MTAKEYREMVVGKGSKTAAKASPRDALAPEQGKTPTEARTPRTAEKREFQIHRATGLHLEQFPARFRITIEGPLHEAEAVEAALQQLKHQQP